MRLAGFAAVLKAVALVLAAVALVALAGVVVPAAVLLVAAAVAARRHRRVHARARADTLARDRAALERRHGPIRSAPPPDIDGDRWRPGCDVVLKGGVTSGVVYPPALLRLARDYRFRSIGGTSAGAIAAGCAAAAELGRRSRGGRRDAAGAPLRHDAPAAPGSGFTGLAAVHRSLGEPVDGAATRLRLLFQAERGTRPLLRLFEAVSGPRTVPHKAARVLRVVLACFWRRALLLALAAAATVTLTAWTVRVPPADLVPGRAAPGGLARYLTGAWVEAVAGGAAPAIQRGTGAALALLLGLAGVLLVAALTGVARIVRVEIPANHYGICSGMTAQGAAAPGLTDWLSATIDLLAFGEPAARAPAGEAPRLLTFGMLWGVEDVPPGDVRRVEGAPPPGADIALELVTTCLNEARPVRLPYHLEDFWFAPSELRRVFPGAVVDHLVDCGRARLAGTGGGLQAPGSGEALLPMPARADLPVVVAVRMSLSLPLVLSAVPLWHRHGGGDIDRCWFSDGGVTSNFPIHLFDSPVPRRPTFGFNLRRWNPGVREPLVDVPGRFDEGAEPYWVRVGDRDLAGFVASVMDSTQSWTDETLSRKPGYRERIAHVYHSRGEGGMNLGMDAATIAALGDRGHVAADILASRYLPGAVAGARVQVSWNSHRWARASVTLAAIGEYLEAFSSRWEDTGELAGQPSYSQLVARGTGEGYPPRPFPLTFGQRLLLRVSVRGLQAVARPLGRLEHGDGSGGSGRRVRHWGITLLRPSARR